MVLVAIVVLDVLSFVGVNIEVQLVVLKWGLCLVWGCGVVVVPVE